MAAHLNTWLMMHDSGQQVFLSIGADDEEQVREYQRSRLLLDPPTKAKQVCDPNQSRNGRQVCYTTYEVNQDRLNNQLQQIP
jgi:hypothetical protein